MEQALLLPKANSFLMDECERLLDWLNRLSTKKISWEQLLEKIGDPLSIARLATAKEGRSLLHLAVLDNRLDVVQMLQRDPTLKQRRDVFGLSPIDLAQLLYRKEAMHLLEPLSEVAILPDLPKIDRFEYLPYPIFETREGLEKILSAVTKAKREDKIPAEKIWMGIYFDKEIQKGKHPPVSIQYVNSEIGYGVFAEKKISPCAFVGEYTGIVQEKKPKKTKKHCLHYAIWEGKKHFTIDAEEKGNFTRFINHSANPNLGLQSVYWRGIPRMIFVALKEICEGAQLTFDYGPPYWKTLRQTPTDL